MGAASLEGPVERGAARAWGRARLPHVLLAFAILVLALALRAYDLDGNPPELFEDELSGIVGIWSVATSGHDVERTWLPFLVTRLEFKQPVYFVATLLPHALLGPAPWAMRLPAALAGVLTTALLMWLVSRVFGGRRGEALVAGALFAVAPWAVHYGRIAWEPAAFLPLSVAGFGLLWLGLSAHRPVATVAAGVVLAVGAYTYHPALLMNATLAVLIVLVWLRRLGREDWLALLVAGGVAAVLLLPYLKAFASEPVFTYRHDLVNVFAKGVDPESIGVAWRNYAEQWNPQWLFLEGHANLRNHPGVPLTFGWVVPFLLLGIFRAMRRQLHHDAFTLAWLALGPLPAALTNDGVPHYTRGILALPPTVLLVASGIAWVYDIAHSLWRPLGPAFAGLLLGVAVAQAVPTYRYYFTEYPIASAPYWYYGAAKAMALARAAVPEGGTLCVETPLPIPYLTFPHYLAYYLDPRSFTVVEGVAAPVCARPGAYLLHRVTTRPPASGGTLGIVTDPRGRAIYALSRVAP